MPKSCTNCEKYPMCEVYRNIDRTMGTSGIINSTQTVFFSLAAHCKYYIEVEDDDEIIE